ncbi:hypothetical protein ZIOFF_035530 [Zingiber officinale]|uniref:Nucleoside-diphosphate kinase n=1 Tax=Zingiber officinale TaxID=94328 RepID=A0A8J5GER2_ZINOF|nr:hypothetical protein ZIOFF_035530 [Zingiber officinale]
MVSRGASVDRDQERERSIGAWWLARRRQSAIGLAPNRSNGVDVGEETKVVPSVIILLDNVSKQAIEMKRAWRWNKQTFIMIKPDGVQRGLVCSPSPSPLISSSFASFIYSSALHCVGEIISRFEKKGFYLKGEDFTNCNPFFVFLVYFREETRNFLGYFCASIRVEVGRRGTLLCGETLRRPLHEALLWLPCGVHHLWSGGSDGMGAKECGGQTMQLRLAGDFFFIS